MTLIKSISGIRGTMGGKQGDNLTPVDIVSFTSGFGTLVKSKFGQATVMVGRDGRSSGEMVQSLVQATLISLGIHVLDAGFTTTPSLEVAIPLYHAQAGIMITASHNPMEWNALKFMNENGEFIDHIEGQKVLDLAKKDSDYAAYDQVGSISKINDTIQKHITEILKLDLVKSENVKSKKFKVVVDAINSTGALAIPPLLEALGAECILLNEEINGRFNHNPEPLPENLVQIQEAVLTHKADLGVVVDPDVDRLAFISEDGSYFGEEYTLVAVADYILKNTNGNTVSNLSSTLALRDITQTYGGQYHGAAVGEVNVVLKMKEVNAIIGGEGNGGIIYPALHYGRDAMVGIALFLSHLAHENIIVSDLKKRYPAYEMSKNKIEIPHRDHIDKIINQIQGMYAEFDINTIDGVKITMKDEWLHLRKSNTEPIIRIYSESTTKEKADRLAIELIEKIKQIQKTLS